MSIVQVQLEDGDVKQFPLTLLSCILDNKKVLTNSDIIGANRIAQGGIIKRAYVPHDVSPLIAVTNAEPSLSGLSAGDIYYNTDTKLLYRATMNDQNQLYWYTGADRADEPKSDRLFVDISNGKIFFWRPVLDEQGNQTTDQQGNVVYDLQQVGGESASGSLSGLTAEDI